MCGFLPVLLALGSCASAPVVVPRQGSWNDRCYLGFAEDVAAIAGPAATDCGFLPLDAAEGLRDATERCARQALKSGAPFKFGYESFGDDSGFCDVAVRNPEGEFIGLFVDYDVSGQAGYAPVASTSRCAGLAFRPGTIGRGSFFDLEECEQTPEIFSTLPSRNRGQ
jgi:hypothetical protein